MAAYLRWAPVFDHSRTFLMVATALCLAALGLLRQEPSARVQRNLLLVLGAGLAAGATLGALQGGQTRAAHYASVAVWDVAELILLLVMLFMLLLSNRVDRYLWAMLAMYACSLALGTFWVTLLSNLGQGWHPPHWTLALLRVVLYGAMAQIAAQRWRAGRRGSPLRGMLGGAAPRVQAWG
jgi:hypothetical protein